MARSGLQAALASYLEEHAVSLVCLNGDAKDSRFKIERERVMLGSGPAAGVVVQGRGIARAHAVVEFWGSSFVLREIDPAAPIVLNGAPCRCRELRDGDRFAIAEFGFEFHCERV